MADFWTKRHKSLGHTGWNDPVIYAYDQIERLAIISAHIERLAPEPMTALDFGCGTGDFSQLLLNKGFTVLGYDPYVEPKISYPGFEYSSELPLIDSRTGDHKFGLILCVTVLDHILDDEEFQASLAFFRTRISERGFLLMIEYAVNASFNQTTKFQAFRTLDLWQNYLIKTGWHIESIKSIPHPTASPSTGFLHYRKSLPVRVISKVLKYFGLTTKLQPILQKYADANFARYGIGDVDPSPLKLMLCYPT